MDGVQIQYLLGLYFLIVSISWASGRISADAVKLIAGLILLLMAFFGRSLIG
jgi:hypothetical protein